MYGAWSLRTGFGKITVVVDDDIDVWDDFAVDWALSWRVRPEKDIYIEHDVQAVGLDPSQAPAGVLQHDPSRNVGSRIGDRRHQKTHISRDIITASGAFRSCSQQMERIRNRRLGIPIGYARLSRISFAAAIIDSMIFL